MLTEPWKLVFCMRILVKNLGLVTLHIWSSSREAEPLALQDILSLGEVRGEGRGPPFLVHWCFRYPGRER
jgi:hypothetical protein